MLTQYKMPRYARRMVLVLGLLAGLGMSSVAGAQPARKAPVGNKAEPVLVDAVVAVVNTEVITRSELKARTEQVMRNFKGKSDSMPSRTELQKQVLEHMIIERIQRNMAKEAGIRVDDAALDVTMGRIAAGNKKTLQEFRQKIEQDGMSYARFREQIRDELIIRRLREKEVDNKVQVSDSEVENVLATSASSQDQQEFNLGHILVRIPENASPEQIAARGKRAEEVLEKLRAGGDFAKLAATYSDAEDALKGGEIGWRPRNRLPQAFGDAVANLKNGEVTPLLKSANGFHILKLLGQRNAAQPAQPAAVSVQQTHARHILIKVNQLVTADEARRKLLELKQRLDNKAAKFEDLAKAFSSDGSATKGGDLGWIYPGDTVPEFERAMNALKPGQVSEPIESPFGFHLIEVLERKTDEVSQERMKMAARQAIAARKVEEATQDWLRQVRDSAYVEYRNEDK